MWWVNLLWNKILEPENALLNAGFRLSVFIFNECLNGGHALNNNLLVELSCKEAVLWIVFFITFQVLYSFVHPFLQGESIKLPF